MDYHFEAIDKNVFYDQTWDHKNMIGDDKLTFFTFGFKKKNFTHQ
jgi:hypothetical protein